MTENQMKNQEIRCPLCRTLVLMIATVEAYINGRKDKVRICIDCHEKNRRQMQWQKIC